MDPTARVVLEQWARSKRLDESAYPVGQAVANSEQTDLGKTVGIQVRVTGHVLRRLFGLIVYHAGVPAPTTQRIYGYVSIDQTLHYVGVGQGEMESGFAVFDTHMRRVPEPALNDLQRQATF